MANLQKSYKLNRNPLVFLLLSFALLTICIGCDKISGSGDALKVRASLLNISITEINYHPIAEDSTVLDDYEFVEIKNTGSDNIDLSDVAFTDGIHFLFPQGTILKSDSFVVLASNATKFMGRYGFAPFDVYTGKLSNEGEEIALKDMRIDKKFLSMTYDIKNPWPQAANGSGFSLVAANALAKGNPNNASFWRASFNKFGSPGKDDPGVVYVNEALTHTDLPQKDAIELFNPNPFTVDISNWFLTDNPKLPLKFRIPKDTKIPANGFKVFDADNFCKDSTAPESFLLSAHGDEIYLFSDSLGTKGRGYFHGVAFGEIENGVSFGRHVGSDGVEHFVEQKKLTLGEQNADPQVGPLVISEIGSIDSIEFIEITNISTNVVTLYDTAYHNNTWKINGFTYAFPKGITLKSGKTLIVISNITIEVFRSRFGIDLNTIVLSAPGSHLTSNTDVVLLRPENPYINDQKVEVVPYKVIDEVSLKSNDLWLQFLASRSSQSLQRISLATFGNDLSNWNTAAPTPGR